MLQYLGVREGEVYFGFIYGECAGWDWIGLNGGEPECVFVSGGWDTQDSRDAPECEFLVAFFWDEYMCAV